MSDTSPDATPTDTPAPPYGAPPAGYPGAPSSTPPPAPYGAPPAYGAPAQPVGAPQPYGAAPQSYGSPQQPYGAPQQPYGAAPAYYGAYAGPKTNVLAVVSMVASIVGFIWILPFIGSLAGVIMGHISLRQLATSGEKGRGMALAGLIVGYVGLALFVVGAIVFFSFVAYAASQGARYSS
ncbi:MAG: DUF4190 domain-containing protein [Microbacterium pygmaeum]